MTRLATPTRGLLAFDGESSTVNYVGEASFVVSEDAPFWRIKRLTYSGSSIKIEWPS